MQEGAPGGRCRLYAALEPFSTGVTSEQHIFNVYSKTTRLLHERYLASSTEKDTGEIIYMVIKLVPSHKFIDDYKYLYNNEVHFYSIIFPSLYGFQKELNVKKPFTNVPRFFRGSLRDEKECLVLEDLSKAGYLFYDRSQCLTSDQLREIFKVYGRFHALSLVYKHQCPEEFEFMTRNLTNNCSVIEHRLHKRAAEYVHSAYLAAMNSFRTEYDGIIAEKLMKVKDIWEVLQNSREYFGDYSCLCHGNSSFSNVLYKHKESGELEDIKLVDFQMVHVSTPVYDLSNIFYSGASKVDMDNLDDFLDVYYDSFSSFARELGGDPERILPFEVLKEDWKRYSLRGAIMGIFLWGGRLMDNKEVLSLVQGSLPEKEENFMQWDDRMSKNSRLADFRERTRDICLHAVEYGII